MPCALLSDHSYSLNPAQLQINQNNISFDHNYANCDKKRKTYESVDRSSLEQKAKKQKSFLIDHSCYTKPVINNKTFPKNADKKPAPDRISVDLMKNVVDKYCFESIQGTDYTNLQVPGDGNCFFHCLSLALNGHFSKTHFYRGKDSGPAGAALGPPLCYTYDMYEYMTLTIENYENKS